MITEQQDLKTEEWIIDDKNLKEDAGSCYEKTSNASLYMEKRMINKRGNHSEILISDKNRKNFIASREMFRKNQVNSERVEEVLL